MTRDENEKVEGSAGMAGAAPDPEDVSAESADQAAAEAPADSADDVVTAAEAVVEEAAEDFLAKAKAEAEEWQGKFMRLHAEWDTYRRRTEEQRAEERVRAGENLVSSLLPVLDDFERSIDYAEANGEAGLLEGVKQVHAKLIGVLEKGGVEVLDPTGEAFDALEHQAVGKVDRTDVPDETVEQVYQKGYKMGKKVIRPAMVTITSGGPKRETPEEE